MAAAPMAVALGRPPLKGGNLSTLFTKVIGAVSGPSTDRVVFSNFVSTLEGVVSLNAKGHASGADISGFRAQDRMVMGLLRAIADVVIIGSGTLDADRGHVWAGAATCFCVTRLPEIPI
jgi:hypothetical protein